jgi:hypothetical protein
MKVSKLTRPVRRNVKRSELRQKQSATLRLARGTNVVVIAATAKEDEKLLLDKQYFDALVARLRSLVETLEIASDPILFNQILGAAKTLDQDVRLGRMHSFAEVFGED